jgi:hypothetical protein
MFAGHYPSLRRLYGCTDVRIDTQSTQEAREMNTLAKFFIPMLLIGVMAQSMPAYAINSEFPGFGELIQKAKEIVTGIKNSITPDNADRYVGRPAVRSDESEVKRKNRIGLIFILTGIALLMIAFSGLRFELGWFFAFLPGIILVLLLWWLFPFFPVFLLFIPLFGIKFVRRGGYSHGPSYPPAQWTSPIQPPLPRQEPNIAHSVYPPRETIVQPASLPYESSNTR